MLKNCHEMFGVMPVDLTGITQPACGAGSLVQPRLSIFDRLPPMTTARHQRSPGCAQRAASLPGQVARAKHPALVRVRLRPSAANSIPFLVRVGLWMKMRFVRVTPASVRG